MPKSPSPFQNFGYPPLVFLLQLSITINQYIQYIMITIIITTIIAYLLITYGSFNTTKCTTDINNVINKYKDRNKPF